MKSGDPGIFFTKKREFLPNPKNTSPAHERILGRIARGQTDYFNPGTNSKIGTSRVQLVGARLPIWKASQKLPDLFAPSLSEQRNTCTVTHLDRGRDSSSA